MTTQQPPDLAAMRALYGKLESGPWDTDGGVVAMVNTLAASVPALLDLIDELRSVIENYHDREIHAIAKARGLLG